MDAANITDRIKQTIKLDELYERLKKNESGEGISLRCKNTGDENKTKQLKITATLGKGATGYVFRASGNEEIALKLSYHKDNYWDELESAMLEMEREYGEYYLNLRWAGFCADCIFISDHTGEKELLPDADVYVSAWEIADHTLKDKMNASFDRKLEWLDQCLKGLRMIHARKRAHFDIKLANLFLIHDRVKIGDFEFYLKIKDFKRLPIDVCGTPGHIAPEMFYDKDNITAQADIFSAGAAFAQLFLGNKTGTPTPAYRDEFIRLPGDKTDQDDVYILSQSQTRELEDLEKHNEFKQLKELVTEEKYNKWTQKKQNLFKINYSFFHSLKQDLMKRAKQLQKELENLKPSPLIKRKSKELKVYRLLLKMMDIHPGKRIKTTKKASIEKMLQEFFNPVSIVGTRLRGRYQVLDIVDKSGRGIIYKILDVEDDEEKAIKLYPPKYNLKKQDIDEIRNEVKSTRKVNHNNIINVYHLERERDLGVIFILMEYFQGENLEKELNKELHKKFPEDKTLKIMSQVLSALINAHEKSVTHNELKPRNIMIDTDGNIKLLNFGWNRQLKHAVKQFTVDKQDFSNDLAYVPPEMYPDTLDKNFQSDIWAFGVTFYRLLTGTLPFENTLQTKTISGPAQPPPAVSGEIWKILLKCLKTNKFHRYQNLQEISRDLDEYEKNKNEQTPLLPTMIEQQKINETIDPDDSSTSQTQNPESPADQESSATSRTPRNKIFQQLRKILPASKGKRLLLVTSFVIIFILLLAIPAELYIFKTGLLTFRQSRYQIWYTGSSGGPGTPARSIGCASSTDGIQWNRYSNNPVIPGNITNRLKGFQPAYPFIVHHNSEYHMLFRLETRDGASNRHKIGYASSENGTHWNIPVYNPVTLDDNNIVSPGPLIFQNGKFHMWYTLDGDIYYAHTAPGEFILKLKRVQDTPVITKGNPGEWDNQAIDPGTVIFDKTDSLFKMWYTGKSGNSSKIGYATSADGIHWNKHPGNPVYDDNMIDREMCPAVVKIASGYRMYYTAASQVNDYSPVRMATSTDGIKWERYSNFPVISGGQAQWEKNKIFITAVTYKEEK
jgi:serine/threonine protein kinase